MANQALTDKVKEAVTQMDSNEEDWFDQIENPTVKHLLDITEFVKKVARQEFPQYSAYAINEIALQCILIARGE